MFQPCSILGMSQTNQYVVIIVQLKKFSPFEFQYLEKHLLFLDNVITLFFSAELP